MSGIHNLAKNNNANEVRQLLAFNPGAVNEQDWLGQSPLCVAAIGNSKETAKVLLAAGANVDLVDKVGQSPLFYAAIGNSKLTADMLLAAGANVDLVDKEGQSPLFYAAIGNSKLTADMLLAAGANVDLVDKEGQSPLFYAAIGNSKETAESLLAAGANVDLVDKEGQSPLFYAVANNYKEMADMLLAAGANVDLVDKNGKPPLMIAKEVGHTKMATLLETYKKTAGSIASPHPSTASSTSLPNTDTGAAVIVLDSTSINIKEEIQTACQMKTRKWNRSNIMIVGEGRAGKTALANSIIGNPFIVDTKSTVGINNLRCSINYADVGNGQWNICDRPEKELETAIAMSIREKKEKDSKGNKHDTIKTNITHTERGKVNKEKASDRKKDALMTAGDGDDKNQPPPPSYSSTVAPVLAAPKPAEIDDAFVAKCLANNIQTSSDLTISLFDFGGQSVFDVIHHLFLTPFGVYIVVFNMTWLAEGATETDRASCWARLEAWVNSIVMHTSEASDNGTQKSSSERNAVPQSAPMVFVGTCKDKVIENTSDSDSLFEDISNKLYSKIDIYRSSVVWNKEEQLWFFPVDNIMGRGDSSLMAILQSIEEVMKQSEHVAQEKPLIWLQALDKLRSRKDITSYPFFEVREMLESCGIVESGVSEVLSFFSKMGELLWIDEDGLRDIVIMDPISFFVTPATRVICKHVTSEERGETYAHEDSVQRRCIRRFPTEWESMVSSGVVRGNLLQALVGANHVVIVNLMVKFGLIVAVLSAEETQNVGVSPNDKKYIVPSLLHPKISPVVNQDQNSPHLTSFSSLELQSSFFFSFFLPTKFSSWSAPLTDFQLESKGYLPHGLFLRYLGKLLTWSLLITPGYDSWSENIYNNEVTILFGKRTFKIRVIDNCNTICVTVEKCRNNAALLLRLKGLLDEVVKECFGILRYEVLLPFHPETVTGVLPVVTPHYYIPIDLVHRAYTQKQPLILPNTTSVERSVLKERYSKWWELHDTSRDCDVFLSYRRGEHDSRFVSLIYDALLDCDYSYVFHDAHVIKVDENLQDTFSKALITAKVFVPFCSHDALVKMMNHNPQEVDNVLLEWILALEAQKRGTLTIVPIPYGSIREGTPFLDFDKKGLNLLPELVPSTTIDKAVRLMKSPLNPKLQSLTVRGVVTNILEFVYSFHAKEFKRLKECIPSCVGSIQEVYPDFSQQPQDNKTPLMIPKENEHSENYKKTVDTTIPLLSTSSFALDNFRRDDIDVEDADKSPISKTDSTSINIKEKIQTDDQLKTRKRSRSKIIEVDERRAEKTARTTSIMGNPFATTDPTTIRSLNFHEVVRRFCKEADDLCEPYFSDGVVTTWPNTKFMLPIQTGINIVSELSALSAEKANRVALAERGVSRALCCLLIDATSRLMLSEKDRNSSPSNDQHKLLDTDQRETETRKYIQSILILIFGYLSDEISLNAYLFVTLFERSMYNILRVLSYPYVVNCLQFLCKYRNEMVQVPALDVVVGLLRCKHTLATEQMDGVADIMNEMLQHNLTKHPLDDYVTQKICEALARICQSSRYFAISFLKKKDLFKIMLLEARSQCLEIRYQALCCLSAMCTVVSNCTLRGIATFLLTLAADSTDGQLSYFPWKEGTAASTFTTSDIVHNELYLLTDIRKWADSFVESLEILSNALKEDNKDIKVVALKGLSYLTVDKQLSLHMVKNGYLENIIEIGTDPDCPVEVTVGLDVVLSNLGFHNADKDIGKAQNSWEVISSWFSIRQEFRTQELAKEIAVQIMNSEYMEDKDFKILAHERFASSLDRHLSYSILDNENTRMFEESSSLLKLLQDSIIDALQKIYSKGLFYQKAYVLEDAVTYFLEEIEESFVKFGTYYDASEVSAADRFSPPVLVAVERRASAAIYPVGSFPSNLSETVEFEGGSQALKKVTDIHSEEDELHWLKSQYPSLLQRSLISVRLALDDAHDDSESIQSLNYRCFDGSLEVMNTFPKWTISLPPGEYLSFNGMGRAMELLIDECHSSHSSDDNVKWSLTFRDSTFGGDLFNDLLDTLTKLPEICSVNFVCQEPSRSEQEGDEKGHSLLGQLIFKLPRTISLASFQSVLTIDDIENLCDLLVSGDSSFCLQSLAIVGHKLEEGEAKRFQNSLIQLLDSQNIVAPRSQGSGVATAISANVENFTIRKAALYYLDVSNNQLDAAACGDILRAACGGTLRGLELSENNISVASDFIMALDTALLSPACQLCHLGLSSTALTPEVVCEILSYLRANSTLLSVDFSGNNIESSLEFNLQLETVFRVNKTLKKINFANNNLNSQEFGGQNTLTSIMNGLLMNHIIHFVCLENNSLTFEQGDNRVYQRIIEKLKQNRMKSAKGTLSVAQNKRDNTVPASDLEKPERNLFYVFFAEPLVRLGNNEMLKAYSKVEYQDEKDVISQVFNNARQAISVRYNFATKPLLNETKMDGFRALHFSGNGNIEGLHFENGRGCLDIVDLESILQLSSELEGPWDFIFLAFSKSQRAGQNFVSTGVRHVICIDTNSELFAIVSNTFCGALYSALASGDTVQQAFDKGKEAVRNSPRDWRYPLVTDTTVEAEKFLLFPEGGFHDVPIFLERMNIPGSLQYISYDIPKLEHLPKLRPHFIAREIDTYTAINDILANRVVQLQGQPGIGKTSVAVAAGRYMAERRMLKGGVIFVGLAKVLTFWGFLYALGEALYLGSLEVREKLTFLINKRNEFLSRAFNDKKEPPQPNANQSYYQGLLVESDHTDSITKSTATEKHEDCAAFLNFMNRLLERCREVRVLLTTSSRQPIRQEGSSGSYGECMLVLQRLNLRMSLQLYCQLSKYFPSKQHQTDFINRFICDDNQPMDERMAERLHQFLVAVFLLTGEGNPAKIRRRVSTNDEQTYRELCKLLERKSDYL